MDGSLIERITELVMAELARAGAEPWRSHEDPRRATPSAPAPAAPKPRQLLVAAAAGPDGPGWQALQGLKGVSWLGVGCSEQLRSRLGQVRCLPGPELWDDAVAGVEAVVLPHLTVPLLARIAQLLGDSPAVGAVLAGIVQGVPVLASSHEVERVKRHANRLPAAFLTLFQAHLRTVEGMGVQLLEPAELAGRLAGVIVRPTASAVSKGRDVVTLEDVETAHRAGSRTLELASGSIVTPLAREAAKQMGIEVNFR